MYLTQKLTEYYGSLSDEKIIFINEHTKGLKDGQIETLFEQIKKEYPSREYGLPEDEEKLLDMLVIKQKSKGVVWSHCKLCDAEYDYKFMFCPVCYRKTGELHSEIYVKTAAEMPQNVIRYNSTSLPINKADINCFVCDISAEGDSYCKYFGRYDYHCKTDDFRECPCKQCCVKIKRANQTFDEQSVKTAVETKGLTRKV